MSWLNFNEGLNSLKGQLTNLAQSVLTEEENDDSVLTPNEYEELRKICLQQEQEIARLRRENENFQKKNIQENESWSWVNSEETTNGITVETTERFKTEIDRLRNENKDLIAQLEQLDSDNQQNVGKLMEVKHVLQTELEKTKASYNELKQLHNISLVKERSLQEEINIICNNHENELTKHRDIQEELRKKYEMLFEEFQKVTDELTNNKKTNNINQESSQLLEKDELQKELEEYKQEITNIQSNNKEELTKHKEVEDHLRKENEKLLKELQKVTAELADAKINFEKFNKSSVEEKQKIIKELEQSVASYSKLEKLHNVSLEKEKLLQEELNSCKRLHDEQLLNLEESERVLILNNQVLVEENDKLKQNSAEQEKLLQEEINSCQRLHEEQLLNLKESERVLILNNQVLVEENDKLKQNSAEKEKILQEEINSCKRLHEEQLLNLKESENVLILNNQVLIEENEKLKQNSAEVENLKSAKLVSNVDASVGTEGKILTTNCEELIDCDLQDSSLDNNCSSRLVDGYSILKDLFETYNKHLENFSKSVSSLHSLNKTVELQEIDNDLKLLEKQTKVFIEQNELIHSRYFNNESFRIQIDNVVLAGLKESYEALKQEIKSEVAGKEKNLQSQANDIMQFTKEVHKIFEDFKRSANTSEYPDFSTSNNELIELSHVFKEIYGFMFELKSKVILLSDSNINIISEKNQEIERLLEKTDQLTQELLEKSQTLKEYENEITELSKNNDMLIADLEVYKNNHLETISEIDEDKTILLEEQLEDAHAQIKDLQYQLEDIHENKESHMDMSGSKIEEEDNSYLELLNKYDELQVEYEILKKDYVNIEKEFQTLVEENKSLKSSVDCLKANSENQLYLQDELKIVNESLQSEIEMYKEKIDNLIKINNKLKTVTEDNENLKNDINSVQETLNKEEQANNNFQAEILELKEKLKLSKMAETSLKLQFDTLSKDFSNAVDTINKLEGNLNNVQSMIASYKKDCQDHKIKNKKLDMENTNLKQVVKNQEEHLNSKKQLVEELDMENTKLKDVVKNQEEQLNSTKQLMTQLEQKLLENISDINKSEDIQILNSTNVPSLIDDNLVENKFDELQQENSELKQQLETLTNSQSELIQLVTTKHQENVAYHTEIERLNQILNSESQKSRDFEMQINNLRTVLTTENQEKQLNIEKLKEENINLKEQCQLLSQSLLDEQAKFNKLLEEKSSSSEAEISLKKKLERLQTHLIELEEHYTSELYEAEQKNLALQVKVNEIEEREKSSSTMYTSVSIRANQQVESLQSQLQAVTNERDSLRKQISDLEDTINKQTAALTNLQLVLEQFRKDKEKEVLKETERLRRQINAEKKVQDTLKNEISTIKSQLEESKQGLSAAARLSDQLENSRNTIAALKEDVSKLQNKLASKQEELNTALSQTDGKVDKSLIKNLVIGFVTCNNNLSKDQTQILKIIGTVLDFNQQDHDKLKLNKGLQGSWLGGLLSPQSNLQNAGQDSLSRAFIEFLEKESKPRVVPSLLNANGGTPKPSSSRSSTPRQSPANLSEIVLPTFADFAQNRNSSSILKDVLKDNS